MYKDANSGRRSSALWFSLVCLYSCSSQIVNENGVIFDTTRGIFNEIIIPFGPPAYSPTNYTFRRFPANQYTHINSKVTTTGLDISSPELFQQKTVSQLYAVFPGTMWCGVGNLAGNSHTLGFFAKTDNCCRAHDKCGLTIASGAQQFGLTNTGYFTRSHCKCDENFFYCLKESKSIVSDKIGKTYFNFLRPQCFRKDFPIVMCIMRLRDKCQLYIVDHSVDMVWQWFDNKEY